jgi:hypothetical protein
VQSSSGSGEPGRHESGVRRLDRRSRADDVGHRVQRLEAVAGVDDDGLERGVELAGVDQLLQDADVVPPAVSVKMPSVRAAAARCRTDLVVGDVLDGPARLAADVEDVDAVGGVADGQALGDRVRL